MISARWKRNVNPPVLPSQLVALALRDLEWVEEYTDHGIDMTSWVTSCGVCFAGAVMIRRFKVPDKYWGPGRFGDAWKAAFWALNSFRKGYITNALATLEIKREFDNINVCPYWRDPVKFKRDIGRVIILLRRAGL